MNETFEFILPPLRTHLTSPGAPGEPIDTRRRPLIFHRGTAGTRVTPRYKISIVCRQSREAPGQMSPLFFVFSPLLFCSLFVRF